MVKFNLGFNRACYYRLRFNSGSRGRAPVGFWGRSPQKLNVFFHFQKVIVALKRGRRPSSVEDLGGRGATGEAAEKGGCSPPAPPVSATGWNTRQSSWWESFPVRLTIPTRLLLFPIRPCRKAPITAVIGRLRGVIWPPIVSHMALQMVK